MARADQSKPESRKRNYTQASSGKLIAAERFATAPINIANDGDEIRITPKITLKDESD